MPYYPPGGQGGGGATVIVADAPPVGAPDNTLWWESDSGILYLLYNDGTSTQWVPASRGVGGGGGGAPTDSKYVIIGPADATLINERVLTAGANITITDSGAGGPVTISASGGGGSGGGRELLTAPRTYFVRTDGNDANTGLADSAGGAFLTIQKAIDVIASTLDIGAQNVTIQIGNGTYNGANTLKNVIGYAAPGNLVIKGNAASPSSVQIVVTGGSCFVANGLNTLWRIQDLKVSTITSGTCIQADNNCAIQFSNIDFGACAQYHVLARFGAYITFYVTGGLFGAGWTITGGAAASHLGALSSGILNAAGATITLTGTPAFNIFAECSTLSQLTVAVVTFSGAATGQRYAVNGNGVLNTAGGGANFIPGSTAGVAASGGQYL